MGSIDLSRFDDRARKVMALANQEAQRFNHGYVGTQHILLALTEERSGVHLEVFSTLLLDCKRIRSEVEKSLKIDPETVPMGNLPKTPNAKEVIDFANKESCHLNHDHVDTGHLLIALMRNKGKAYEILSSLGLTERQVRDEVLNCLGRASLANAETESITQSGKTHVELLVSEVQHAAFRITAAPALYLDVIRETDGEVICTPSDHQTHENAEAELRGFGPGLKLLQHAAFTVDPGADNTLITLIALSNFGDGSDPASLKSVIRELISFVFDLGKKYGQEASKRS